jgi:hypothetical protein
LLARQAARNAGVRSRPAEFAAVPPQVEGFVAAVPRQAASAAVGRSVAVAEVAALPAVAAVAEPDAVAAEAAWRAVAAAERPGVVEVDPPDAVVGARAAFAGVSDLALVAESCRQPAGPGR